MVTGRKHIPLYLYKMGQHLDKQYEEIVKALDAKAQARNARDDVWELKQTIKDKDNELEDAKWSFEVMSKKLQKQEVLLAKVPEDIMKKINPKEKERER